MDTILGNQRALFRPSMPVQRGNVRISNLTVINAILFVAENGCKWRTLPLRFGNWHTVYTRMRRWAEAGVLDRLLDALQAHHMIRVSVDCLGLNSTSVKDRGWRTLVRRCSILFSARRIPNVFG